MDYLKPLIESFKASANPENAIQMQNYLKGLFPFYGIRSPERKIIEKEFFKSYGLPTKEKLFEVINEMWSLPEREYQHSAIIILQKFEKKLEEGDIRYIENLIVEKSWWDSVDGLSVWICGSYFKKFPEQINTVTSAWVDSDNIWLQRSALLFQLKYKKETNVNLLTDYINKLSGSNEFFVRKAIGWVLREYSKVNPSWVREFLNNNKLSNLSYREAIKYI